MKKFILFFSLGAVFFWQGVVFAQPVVGDYLAELGREYYQSGNYRQALLEFNKALELNPQHLVAREYIDLIANEIYLPKDVPPASYSSKNREKAIEEALRGPQFPASFSGTGAEAASDKEDVSSALKLSGEIITAFGVNSQNDFIWKRANYDLNEENWRLLSSNGLNNRLNTYDPHIFDRLRLNLDSGDTEGFKFHSNITVDPWSYVGKSDRFTISGAGGDKAELEIKDLTASGYALNETIYTLANGDAFALPELKVVDGRILPATITSTFGNTFNIPETKIEYQFQPLRELWFDYKKDDFLLRFFPIAYIDQAYTSNDPLQISGHQIYWEESPWLDKWVKGNFNSGAASPGDFTKGRWSDALSDLAHDSDNTALTSLRGLSLEAAIADATDLAITFASPRYPWEEYERFDDASGALRIKHKFSHNFLLGTTVTAKTAFSAGDLDALNNVFSLDTAYLFSEGIKLSAQGALSRQIKDKTNQTYETKDTGSAFYLSLIAATLEDDILQKRYEEIKPNKESQEPYAKARFYAAHMDTGFSSGLASYRQTRDDAFWGRHIHFREPLDYYYGGLYYPSLSYDDIEVSRIGDGIDIGRDVLGLRIEFACLGNNLAQLLDIRNVHRTSGKYAETAARSETTYNITSKVTAKLLGIAQDFPDTIGGIDPFIFDANTGEAFLNSAIPDGKPVQLKTGSLGLEYALAEWVSLNGIWEHTNDSTLAYDNFPRGLLNSSNFTTYYDYGKIYRQDLPFLYSQGLFPLPPYPYYDIFKAGLRLAPIKELELYLDWTRNEFESAGLIDDNMNHSGIEIAYAPQDKLGLLFKYTYSYGNDLSRMVGAKDDSLSADYHNFYFQTRYRLSDNGEFSLEYGVYGYSPIVSTTVSPFGGGLAVLETQHILRMYYRRKF